MAGPPTIKGKRKFETKAIDSAQLSPLYFKGGLIKPAIK